MDTDPSPSTMTFGDPSVTTPSVRPTPGALAWAVDGAGHVGALGAATVASGYGPPITAATTSTYIEGAPTGLMALYDF